MLRPFVPPTRRRTDAGLAKLTIVLGLAGVVLLGGGTAALLVTGRGGPLTAIAGTPTPAPTVGVALAGANGDTIPWKRPLTFAVTDGTIESLTVTGPDGLPYDGTLTPTRWAGRRSLLPGAQYALRAELKDNDGETTVFEKTYTAAMPEQVLHASIDNPGAVVGVGQPVIIRFDQKVKGAAARQAVMKRLQVTTRPHVAGAWRWYNSLEVHYRAQEYWKKGTTIRVAASLDRLRVPGTDVWGAPERQQLSFSVGTAMVSTADLTAHTLTVTQDGKVLKVLKMSAGSEKYPTKGGVHIVLLKEKVHTFNSATVGIPTNSPDGYYTKLPWSVRISNGGAFVHAQPGSIRAQGFRNVSHGCINLSPTDAEWFFGLAKKGDVVDIVHAIVPPVRWDAGMADWNYSWDEWSKGNLDG